MKRKKAMPRRLAFIGRRLALSLVAVLVFVATGCIGAVVHWNDRQSIPEPFIGWSSEGVWVAASGGALMSGSEGRTGMPATREQVTSHWGPPDEVERIGDHEERWTDDGALRWNGIMLALVIVPVPLIVPVGHDRVTFVVRDDRIVEAEVLTEDEAAALLGVNIVNPGPCYSLSLGRFELSTHDPSTARFLDRVRQEPNATVQP